MISAPTSWNDWVVQAVEETSVPRRTVVVSGTVAQFSDVFAVEMNHYEAPKQTYRGREGLVYVPGELAEVIEGVFGLDNRRIGGHNSGEGASSLTPPQVAQLYHFPTGRADGQTIGILTFFGGYRFSDVEAFFRSLGGEFHPPTIVHVNIDKASNQPGSFSTRDPIHNQMVLANDSEVLGDICVASSVAQGARIALYFAPWSQAGWVAALKKAIHPEPDEPRPSVISTSWFISNGDDETALVREHDGATPGFINAVHTALQEAALLGITIFASAGDWGSDSQVGNGSAHVQYPGSDPWMTSCGGTALSDVSGSSFTEGTWNDSLGATGGGVSDRFPLPSYQRNAGVPTSVNDAHQRRGVPDIAGNASTFSGYALSLDSKTVTFSGTSSVAPFYAGLIALINARLGRPVGFLNPALYALGTRSGVFRDINDGLSNAFQGAPGYPSGPGWDACTGWGSVNGQALLEVVKVRLHVDCFREHTPDNPDVQALVHDHAQVTMEGGPYLPEVQDGDFTGFEEAFTHVLRVSITLEIWRSISHQVKQGHVEMINGQRYIVFGPHERSPVPADWDRLTPEEQARFKTIIITPTVSPGLVRSFSLIYDLLSGQISGDVIGSAGQSIHILPDPNHPFTPEVWFTISQV